MDTKMDWDIQGIVIHQVYSLEKTLKLEETWQLSWDVLAIKMQRNSCVYYSYGQVFFLWEKPIFSIDAKWHQLINN